MALRADMDALPIEEETGVDFRHAPHCVAIPPYGLHARQQLLTWMTAPLQEHAPRQDACMRARQPCDHAARGRQAPQGAREGAARQREARLVICLHHSAERLQGLSRTLVTASCATCRLIFQPAEESGAGGELMVQEGEQDTLALDMLLG